MATVPDSLPAEALPPPRRETGLAGWVRANLFSNWYNSALTLLVGGLAALVLWYGLRWLLIDADFTVISTLGGLLLIGQYNAESACSGQNCFWRPQVALMMVTLLLGMTWVVAGGGIARRIAIMVVVVISLFAFLPYSLERMGWDVRLLLLANIPSLLVGWALARYTPLGSWRWVATISVLAFLLTLVLLRGIPEVPGLQLVSVLHWGGLMLNLLLGMTWVVAGGGIARRIAIIVVVVISLFAFLPYSLERMGWDVRLLLLANIPSLLVGWALARYTPLGSWRWVATISVLAFLLTLVLLRGIPEVPGLQPVSVLHWGGLMLNLLLAVAGIVVSFPIGIALALGRRSRLPVVKLLCVVFIEVFRGVPLITLLFMSQVLVPLAFPANFPLNSVLRAAIIITLFSAAYMAENIRGGLQALDPGQEEAARALGLPQWQTTMFISLPQAIRNVIPTIVGQFIALFKDTTLVYIIGMLDILELSRKFATTYVENGTLPYLDNVRELFIFLALVFWVFTYGMSYISGRVERHLGVGVR